MTMRAVVRRGDRLAVEALPVPRPAAGQVLLKVKACGICGSDLHALANGDRRRVLAERAGFGAAQDASQPMVFGHEFCGEVVAYGPGTPAAVPVGSLAVAAPYVVGAGGTELIGFSNSFPGGYGEYLVASANLLLPVPETVSPAIAAMTEPFAVGVHAVNVAGLDASDVPVIIGCGPVGLAIIAALHARGVTWIGASDRSPARRAMARALGATMVIDPAAAPLSSMFDMAGIARQRRDPLVRCADQTAGRRLVMFECVGRGGMLGRLIEDAPPYALIVSVGASQETDPIEPWIATVKQLDIRFAHGYSLEEFEQTLAAIVSGNLVVAPIITGEVGLDGVIGAFAALADPESQVKIVINPELSAP